MSAVGKNNTHCPIPKNYYVKNVGVLENQLSKVEMSDEHLYTLYRTEILEAQLKQLCHFEI